MSDFSQPPQQRDFFCPDCNGRIVIPFSLPSTTGPCPHCQSTITSPPPPELQSPPQQLAQPQYQPPPGPAEIPAPARQPAIPPQRDAPSPAKQNPSHLSPAADKKQRSSGIIPALLGLFLLIIAAGGAVYFITREMGKPVDLPTLSGSTEDKDIKEANYIRIGWQKEAFDVLGNFIAAHSVGEKLPFVTNAAQLKTRMDDFYGGGTINDSDTPADSFAIQDLSEEDRKRGIFMLSYDQPPQFAMKDFFRPLATLEVQYGIDEADILLSTMARVSNFAMEPVRVHAFFKRTDSGLKLDWEVFAQTKYRMFQNFVELPDINRPETFRILIVEDVPEKGQGVRGTRTYRLSDPANIDDSARINVVLDSDIGRALSVINWRGTKQNYPTTRTATVTLEWTGQPDSPVLEMKRFICWEFLGLGGKEAPATASAE